MTGGAHHVRPRAGADVAAADGFAVLQGRAPLVLTNPTGVVAPAAGGPAVLRSTVAAMVESGVEVVAAAGPEHGFTGTAQAGFAEADATDPVTGVRTVDAYTAGVEGWERFLVDLAPGCVVVDLADVGCRFYTYPVLMEQAMTACARRGVPVVVLDRPNPLGRRADGPVLTDRRFASGVGTAPVALQHGLTLGELARLLDAEVLPRTADRRLPSLEVVPVEGWIPSATSPLPVWVPPSPNVPTRDTAWLYPAGGLFEAVSASEGRGTTRPFATLGAPWMDHRFAETVGARRMPGVEVRTAGFVPTFDQFGGETCVGAMVHVTDPDALRPVALGMTLLEIGFALYPQFGWREDTRGPAATDGVYWIDKLTGCGWVRDLLDRGAAAADVEHGWQDELAAYEQRRSPHLLY